jgi:hypothetical protein
MVGTAIAVEAETRAGCPAHRHGGRLVCEAARTDQAAALMIPYIQQCMTTPSDNGRRDVQQEPT